MPVPATIRPRSRIASVRSASSTRSQRPASASLMSSWNAAQREEANSRSSSWVTGAGSMADQLRGILPRHADRDHHGLRHVRAAGVRVLRARAGEHRVGRGAGLARHLRRRGRAARLAPWRGPPPALEPRHPPRQHRRAGRPGRRRGHRPDGLRSGRRLRRAGVGDLLRRPALPGQPPRGRRAVHVLLRARRPPARALDLRGPVLGAAASCAAGGRRGGGRGDPRRRLLRPRRRAALQHARRDPRPGGLRRHARVADRRAGGGAVRRGRAPVRAARLRDRLRQRRHRGGHAGADAARHDGRQHGDVRLRAGRGGAARRRRGSGAGGHGVSVRSGASGGGRAPMSRRCRRSACRRP